MDLSWHALNSVQQVKNLYHTEKQGLATRGFQKKNSRHAHQDLLKPSPVSERSAYPMQTTYAFPAHLWVREFWPQTTPSAGPGLRPTVQTSS